MDNLQLPGTRVKVKHSGEAGVVAKWPAPVDDRIRVKLDSGRSYVCRPDEVELESSSDPHQPQAFA